MARNKGCDQSQKGQVDGQEWQQSNEWKKFEEEFSLLLDPASPSGASFLAFIRQRLRQFHLDRSCSSADILSETYIRAAKLIRCQGVEILNPPAWGRKTAYNIIRERSRQQQRFVQLEESTLSEAEQVPTYLDLEGDLTIMAKAFQCLPPDDQNLLNLKIVESLSWREVQKVLAHKGQDVTEQSLRKRKERVLKKLKQIFDQLKGQTDYHDSI